MTPNEKAKELVDKLYQTTPNETCFSPEFETGNVPYKAWEQAKQCALIAVDEIIDAIDWHEYEVPNDQLKFWFEVKREIESYMNNIDTQ